MFHTPATFFGESLQFGTERIAEFFLWKSVGGMLISLSSMYAVAQGYHGYVFMSPIAVGFLLFTILKLCVNIAFSCGARKNLIGLLRLWLSFYMVQTALIVLIGFWGGIVAAVMGAPPGTPYIFYFLMLVYATLLKNLCHVVHGRILQLEGGRVYSLCATAPAEQPPSDVQQGAATIA